jgi:hypothetical protein
MKMFSVDVVLTTTAYVAAPSREAAVARLTKAVGKPYAASNELPKFENGAEVLLQRDDRSIAVGNNVWLSPVVTKVRTH